MKYIVKWNSFISFVVLIGLSLLFQDCKKPDLPPTGDTHLELSINGDKLFQPFYGFGASDAWSCQFIGENWPIEKRNQIADWLFSKEMDENDNPIGIGLDIWRFNIGGGSALQGSGSGIQDVWRRADSFLTEEGEFDPERHKGQRWFMKAAKDRGVEQFIAFVNSPPVNLTKNGKAYSSSSSSYNLKTENYSKFASFLADIIVHFESQDQIKIDYISPFNEPQWDWTNGGQEGSPAQNHEIAALCKKLDSVIMARNLNVKIEIPEAAQIQFLYDDHNKTGRGKQIDAFFNPDSDDYLGDLPSLANKVAGHSYYSTWPLNEFTSTRKELALNLDNSQNPIEYWMTEYCILENNSEIKGSGRDLGMDAALYASRVIMADLNICNANSWQWWLGVSPYNYKDGLVYTDYNKFDGNIYDSKILWAMGNFSRFITKGMKRAKVTRSDHRNFEQNMEGIMSTAFISGDSSVLTMVIINYSTNPIPIKINLLELPNYSNLKHYLTNSQAKNNLSNQGEFDKDSIYLIPSRSVLTISNHE